MVRAARMGPEPDRIIGGKYRLEKPLAKGGMGSVWVARHTELDSPVAVKFMARELVGTPVAETRFKREAKAAAQIRSPHVVGIQDYGVEDGAPYMVMELLEGEDLAAHLAREQRLSVERIAEIVSQITKALALAHAAGIVHRDLKPSNLFLARSGDDEVVKVLDFGVAKDTHARMAVDKTISGVLVGSPMYMSPEQARGESLDFRSDLWSIGVVVYEALTGRVPFESDHLGALLAKIYEANFIAPSALVPGLAGEVDLFLARALAKRPEDRFQSARELSDALAAVAKGTSSEGDRDTVPAPEAYLPPAQAFSSKPPGPLPAPPQPTSVPASSLQESQPIPLLQPSRPTGPEPSREAPAQAVPIEALSSATGSEFTDRKLSALSKTVAFPSGPPPSIPLESRRIGPIVIGVVVLVGLAAASLALMGDRGSASSAEGSGALPTSAGAPKGGSGGEVTARSPSGTASNPNKIMTGTSSSASGAPSSGGAVSPPVTAAGSSKPRTPPAASSTGSPQKTAVPATTSAPTQAPPPGYDPFSGLPTPR
ncbi:MAG: protein kinase [Polyangiaceae bacterium]